MQTELQPAGGGPNRLFLIIAIGLGGLLVIGIIAVGAFFLLNGLSPKPATAPTVAIKLAATTPTVRPTNTLAPTDTPAPTNTSVLSVASASSSSAGSLAAPGAGGVITATGALTGTPGAGTPGTGQLPQSGLGENLLLLAGGVVLVLVIFAARRARSISAA